MVDTSFWDIPVEDNAFALLKANSGQIATIHSSSTQWKHKFSYFQHSISSTGSPITNPRGHKILRAGVIVVGIAKIPDFVFIYSKNA